LVFITVTGTSQWADWVRGKLSSRGIAVFHQRRLNVRLHFYKYWY